MKPSGRRQRRVRVQEAAVRPYAPERAPEAAAPPQDPSGVLMDSDIVIEILRGKGPALHEAAGLRDAGIRTYCSAISFAEVFAGLRPGEEEITDAFFTARGEVVLDAVAGRRAGSYLARYRRSHGLGIADALTAAAASTSGLLLWTRNRKHYPMPDVRFYEAPA